MSPFRCVSKHPAISMIESCTRLGEIKQIQTQLLVHDLLNDPLIHGQFSAAIALSHPNHLHYSHQVLDQFESPTLFSLNTMIRAHSKSPTPRKSFHFYNQILLSAHQPDNYTFTFLVRTCTHLLEHKAGSSVHSALLKRSFDHDPHIQSGMIDMYAEFGCLASSRRVFMYIPYPDLVIQTAMLSALVKFRDVALARKVFESMPRKDHVSWNAMISGYAQCGRPRDALDLFHSMQMKGAKVNEVCMVSVLFACAHLGALDQGRWAHSYIERNKISISVTLGTALVDMYAKCGDMNKALEIFWGLKEKNVYTWSSAIGGLAMNGAGKECLELFSCMKQKGVLPNEVTFVSVLKGCSAVGLVDEGIHHFKSMSDVYNIVPKLEHYGCVVDLYGRSGRLDEAMSFIKKMPITPHAGAWGALLNACRIYKNMALGELAWRKLVELEDMNHGAFVVLSNIYAESRNWDSVNNVRDVMRLNGVRKLPGCSVIEVGGEVDEFFAGDKSHPRYDEIEKMLRELSTRLKISGWYVGNTGAVLFDI